MRITAMTSRRLAIAATVALGGATSLLATALPASATGPIVFTTGDTGTYYYCNWPNEEQEFTLSSPATIGSLLTPLHSVSTYTNPYFVEIETDNSGAPSGTAAAAGATTDEDDTGSATFTSPITLSAGTYWVVQSGDQASTAGQCGDAEWDTGTSGADGLAGGSVNTGVPFALTIYGASPQAAAPIPIVPTPTQAAVAPQSEVVLARAGGTVTLSATVEGLVVGQAYSALSAQTVTFDVNGESCSATTNLLGVASCSVPTPSPGGAYTVTELFSGTTTLPPTINYSEVLVW